MVFSGKRFSLHAGMDMVPLQRPKFERLCRYVSRPSMAKEHMAMTSSAHVRYALEPRTVITPRTS